VLLKIAPFGVYQRACDILQQRNSIQQNFKNTSRDILHNDNEDSLQQLGSTQLLETGELASAAQYEEQLLNSCSS
jgi:hypothetical protein